MTRDRGWFSSLIPVVTKRYITFGDNGRGRVLSEGEIKVTDKITLRRVALVQSLGYNFLSVSQLLDEGFEVLFRCNTLKFSNFRMLIGKIIKHRFSHNFKILPKIYLLYEKFSIGKSIDCFSKLN
jgi:hypothetical protein